MQHAWGIENLADHEPEEWEPYPLSLSSKEATQ